MELDKTQLQWLLAGVGFIVVLLIFLWGHRDKLRKRRRQQPSLGEEPVFEAPDASADKTDPSAEETYRFGDRVITRNHPLAKDALVDVELSPVEREDRTGQEKQTPPGNSSPLQEYEIPPIKLEPAASPQTDTAPEEAEKSDAAVEPVKEAATEPPPRMTVAFTIIAPEGAMFLGTDIQIAAENAQLRFSGVVDGLFDRFPDKPASEDGEKPVFSMAHLRDPGTFDTQALDTLLTPGLLLFMQLPGVLEEMEALDLMLHCADQIASDLNGIICDERRHPITNQALLHLRGNVADLGRQRRMWMHNSQ